MAKMGYFGQYIPKYITRTENRRQVQPGQTKNYVESWMGNITE